MDDSTEYKCENCQKTFDNERQYVGHMSNCSKNHYKCSICKNVFQNQEALGIHISKHKSVLPYPCDEFESKIDNETHTKEHKKSKHSTEIYNCQQCSKVCTY